MKFCRNWLGILGLLCAVYGTAFGAGPTASLSSSDSSPARGDTITLTGSYSDPDGNLYKATIRDLGSGDKTGDLGTYPPIGAPGDSVSGYNDTLTRTFTIPTGTPLGDYTFRTEVVDAGLPYLDDIEWLVVDVENSVPVAAILGYPVFAYRTVDRDLV